MIKILNKILSAIVWVKSVNVCIMHQNTHHLAGAYSTHRSGEDAFVFESSYIKRGSTP